MRRHIVEFLTVSEANWLSASQRKRSFGPDQLPVAACFLPNVPNFLLHLVSRQGLTDVPSAMQTRCWRVP